MNISKIIIGLDDIRTNDYDDGTWEDEILTAAINLLTNIKREEDLAEERDV